MIKTEFKEISNRMYQVAHEKAYSIESKDNIVSTQYIGSIIQGNIIYDYYIDDNGNYWYGNRAIDEDGCIITMDKHIFGRSLKTRSYRNYITHERK